MQCRSGRVFLSPLMFALAAPYPTRMTHEELVDAIDDVICEFIGGAIRQDEKLQSEFHDLCNGSFVTVWYYPGAAADIRWGMEVDGATHKAESFPKLVEILRGIKHPLSTEPPIAKLDV